MPLSWPRASRSTNDRRLSAASTPSTKSRCSPSISSSSKRIQNMSVESSRITLSGCSPSIWRICPAPASTSWRAAKRSNTEDWPALFVVPRQMISSSPSGNGLAIMSRNSSLMRPAPAPTVLPARRGTRHAPIQHAAISTASGCLPSRYEPRFSVQAVSHAVPPSTAYSPIVMVRSKPSELCTRTAPEFGVSVHGSKCSSPRPSGSLASVWAVGNTFMSSLIHANTCTLRRPTTCATYPRPPLGWSRSLTRLYEASIGCPGSVPSAVACESSGNL